MVVDKNELERELVSIDENLVRKDLSKMEVESHLRRAKEIYTALNPVEEIVTRTEENEKVAPDKKTILPAERFLTMVSEKTGLSPKQIHEAINRDEMASSVVKDARIKGELSLSQTNEIVKLDKKDQQKAIEHIKELPVREIKKFVKIAKVHGIEEAIQATPNLPFQKEFQEVEIGLKKLLKKMKQLQFEGIELDQYPHNLQALLEEVKNFSEEGSFHFEKSRDQEMDSLQ
jgi:ParB family chromosome partitioning protein